MRHRYLAWFLLGGLTLAACGGAAESNTAAEGSGTTAAPSEPSAPSEASTEGSDPVDALYQAALEEGPIQYWSATSADLLALVIAEFEEQFPGLEVEHFDIRPEEGVPRALAEAEQGRVAYDVGEGRLSTIEALLDRDLIEPHADFQDVFGEQLEPEAIIQDGILARTHLTYPITYNSDLVSADEAPKTWEDLLDPKWKGNLLIESRGAAFTHLSPLWGEEKTLEFARGIRDQEPVFVRGGTATRDQLAAGVAAVAIGPYAYVVEDGKGEGMPIEWVPVSPMGASVQTVYTMAGAANPNAAKLFAGWLASNDGIEAFLEHSHDAPVTHGPSSIAEAFRANDVELVLETLDNYAEVAEMAAKVTEALGVQ